MAQTKVKGEHYVKNADFSRAVVEYCLSLSKARDQETTLPIVPNYIATCFLKICEGLSYRDNFIKYSYREEMVMDAVENCIRAIENYNVEAATRSGNPNAFAYFTQIAWYAFLRRIAKEKRQQDIKLRYITQTGIADYIISNTGDIEAASAMMHVIDQLKDRIDKVKEKDTEFTVYTKATKMRAKHTLNVDSDLQDYMEIPYDKNSSAM